MSLDPSLHVSSALTGLVVGLLGGALAGRFALSRALRARQRELSDECVAVALLSSDAGDHGRALSWIRHARELAPSNAGLAMQEAWCLGEMGRLQEALEAYAEAAFLSRDGRADFDAALLVLRSGGEESRAEERLSRALYRTPALVLEAQAMEEFRKLRGRLGYESAMARAADRLRAKDARSRGGHRT